MHKKCRRNAYKKSVILWMAHQILSENFENQEVLLKGNCTIKSLHICVRLNSSHVSYCRYIKKMHEDINLGSAQVS